MGVRLDLRAGRRPSCYCRDSGSRLAGARNGQAAGSDPGCGDRAQPGERLGRRGAAPSIGRPVIEHWNGHRWSVSKLPTGLSGAGRGAERQQLEQRATRIQEPAGDGHGGLWLTTGWDSTGVPPHLIHFAGSKLVRLSMPTRNGRYVGVFSLANIPRTTSVWGVGALTGLGFLGANTGVVLKYGR